MRSESRSIHRAGPAAFMAAAAGSAAPARAVAALAGAVLAAAFLAFPAPVATAVVPRVAQQAPAGIQEFTVPRGSRPHDVAPAPDGMVYYASLAGNYVGRTDPSSCAITVLEPPTPRQGARRVWPDSRGRIWVSEWNAGQVGMFDPGSGRWRE